MVIRNGSFIVSPMSGQSIWRHRSRTCWRVRKRRKLSLLKAIVCGVESRLKKPSARDPSSELAMGRSSGVASPKPDRVIARQFNPTRDAPGRRVQLHPSGQAVGAKFHRPVAGGRDGVEQGRTRPNAEERGPIDARRRRSVRRQGRGQGRWVIVAAASRDQAKDNSSEHQRPGGKDHSFGGSVMLNQKDRAMERLASRRYRDLTSFGPTKD